MVRVVPGADGGWDVREPGSNRALVHAAEKEAAVLRARAMMLHGGVVQVLDNEGFLVEARTVSAPADKPWWYVPSTPVFGVMGVLFLVLGILGITTDHVSEPALGLYLLLGLMGVFYLVVVISSRRRDRALQEV